jgi:CRP-like cAMP-binding protein
MDLAEMVGSTRESVSQAVGRMRRFGLIATEGGGLIAILSEEGLKEMYER